MPDIRVPLVFRTEKGKFNFFLKDPGLIFRHEHLKGLAAGEKYLDDNPILRKIYDEQQMEIRNAEEARFYSDVRDLVSAAEEKAEKEKYIALELDHRRLIKLEFAYERLEKMIFLAEAILREFWDTAREKWFANGNKDNPTESQLWSVVKSSNFTVGQSDRAEKRFEDPDAFLMIASLLRSRSKPGPAGEILLDRIAPELRPYLYSGKSKVVRDEFRNHIKQDIQPSVAAELVMRSLIRKSVQAVVDELEINDIDKFE